MRARLRGLVLGYGHMGRIHAARLAERGDVDVTVTDPGLGLHGGGGPLDFAVVSSPTSTHAALALPLLELGVACLVEKPLAADLATARLLAAWPRLSAGHVERFNPALDAVAGARPRFVEAERLAPFRSRGTDTDVVRDLMVHDLDLALRFLPGAPGDVRAVGAGVCSGQADVANARVEIGDGVALLTASRVSRAQVRRLRLVEDGVYWSVDLLARAAHRVRWGEGSLEAEPVEVGPGDAISREHDAFLAAVRGEGPFPVPGPEALAVMELAESIVSALSPDANPPSR